MADVITWSADEIVFTTPKLLPGNHKLLVWLHGCPNAAK